MKDKRYNNFYSSNDTLIHNYYKAFMTKPNHNYSILPDASHLFAVNNYGNGMTGTYTPDDIILEPVDTRKQVFINSKTSPELIKLAELMNDELIYTEIPLDKIKTNKKILAITGVSFTLDALFFCLSSQIEAIYVADCTVYTSKDKSWHKLAQEMNINFQCHYKNCIFQEIYV